MEKITHLTNDELFHLHIITKYVKHTSDSLNQTYKSMSAGGMEATIRRKK